MISATNKNLQEEVEQKRFRSDLYYRLCVVPVSLPPLRERANDIPVLAEHLLKKACSMQGREDVKISSEAIDMLMDYAWPGNVRELENAIQYTLVKCREELILPCHFPARIVSSNAEQVHVRQGRTGKLNSAKVFRALEDTGGNKKEAAGRLGVSRATLYRFLKRHSVTN